GGLDSGSGSCDRSGLAGSVLCAQRIPARHGVVEGTRGPALQRSRHYQIGVCTISHSPCHRVSQSFRSTNRRQRKQLRHQQRRIGGIFS
ncbi:hypothetical protein L9F63_016270, partial [Diploptera punctata]